MPGEARRSGIDIAPEVPWGTHLCQFYRTKEDLIEVLAPYFKAGLENNEFCMWICSEPLNEKEAEEAMRETVPNFERYLRSGQIQILPHTEWYLKEGAFSPQRVLYAWVDELHRALSNGYDGMRSTGNTAWLERRDWRSFVDYEDKINKTIGKYSIIALCAYPLDKCGAAEVIDVASNHQASVVRREGKWECIGGSEGKRAEEVLLKAKQEAEAASRAKRDFLARMSHEIRTPMNAIMGFTDLALETELTPEQQEYLETVKVSADSLLWMLNDILDVSKMEARHLDLEEIDFDLRTTLETTSYMLATKAHEKGLDFTCHIEPEVPTRLVGDPGRLRQIIVNLGGNAMKFTETGGVSIVCGVESKDRESVLLHFSVSDTGIGIPEHKLDAIFEGFEQVDGSITRKYGGIGLGLSISNHLSAMMGGRIWVESELGKGSTFHFTVRFRLQPEKRLIGPEPIDLQGVRVLIVDDNSANRLMLREMVSSWGFSHGEATDGKGALTEMEKALRDGSPYRLVLMDLLMPDMDGFEVSECIRKNRIFSDVRIILLTSAGLRGDANRCREIGISAYLPKPIRQSELFDTIMSVMRHEMLGPMLSKTQLVTRHTILEERQGRGSSILMANDSPTMQQLATGILKRRGHSVALVNNGREVLEALEKRHFDLILMDVKMPEMDGVEATQRIRASKSSAFDPQIPIIAMTADSVKAGKERCLEAGMNAYIAKPLQIEELLEIVEKFAPAKMKQATFS